MNFNYYRQFFPVTRDYIYLDHAGVAPISVRVKEAVAGFLEEATSKGAFSYDVWMEKIEHVRSLSAQLVGSKSSEIAFVKNTSHGVSLVASGLEWKQGDNVVIYEKEFPSNVYPWMGLLYKGVEVKKVGAREDGTISIEDIASLIDKNTRVVSISSVQFTNSFRIDTKKLGDLCAEKGVFLFIDAIQSLGLIPTNVRKERISFLAADGHKWLLSPEGLGIFYCSENLAPLLKPSLLGWKSVVKESDYENIDFRLKENALRFEEGSLNVIGIMALGASLELLFEVGVENVHKRVNLLGDLIIKRCDERGFYLITPRSAERRGGAVTFSGRFDPVYMRDRLRECGVMVNVRGGGLRVSPHFYNTEDEIEELFNILDKLI